MANEMFLIFGLYWVIVMLGGIVMFTWTDVIYSLKRKFIPKGCDVYVINSSRQMAHKYLVPKDGCFKIMNKTYIVNPKKIINMDEKTSEKVSKSLKQRKNTIEMTIRELEKKITEIDAQATKLAEEGHRDESGELLAMKETLSSRIANLKEELESGEEYFYNKKRAAFFYIEGDPVPKNLFDNYSELDCDIIDNLIASCLTKDPKSIKEFEKAIKSIKLWLYISAGAGVLCLLVLLNMSQKGIKCIGAI